MSVLTVQLPADMALENGRGLVDKNSQKPTAERAFTIGPWWIARRSEPTVLYGKFCFFGTAEHAARREVKQPAAAREPVIKDLRVFPGLDLSPHWFPEDMIRRCSQHALFNTCGCCIIHKSQFPFP
jgi:hypothetical protein